jgi:hypothetical protein
MTVKELLWLIECRIEGEKILPCSYHWSIEMDQGHYDNPDNLERLQFIVQTSREECESGITKETQKMSRFLPYFRITMDFMI